MEPLIWTDKPELRDPVLVAAFKGWNDAGESATAAVGFLVESFDATEVARIDPEEFFDFTAVRPNVRLTEGRSRAIDWPATVISAAHIPSAHRDLVFLQGVEPSLRWKTFAGAVAGAADELGVKLVLTLGALLADVPHSRAVNVSGLASDQGLIDKLGLERTTYEGPTGIVGVLHDACQRASLPSASLWAAVPHYVAAAPNPKAALALVRKLEGLVGVSVDASELESASVDYERQVNLAVQSDPDVQAFVERLEAAAEDVEETPFNPSDVPSGDTIAREFQRFLRQRGQDS